jgi:hypothetical protein
MHGEMCTHTEAVSDFGWATHSATSPHSAADAYRFPAPYSGAAPVDARVDRLVLRTMVGGPLEAQVYLGGKTAYVANALRTTRSTLAAWQPAETPA